MGGTTDVIFSHALSRPPLSTHGLLSYALSPHDLPLMPCHLMPCSLMPFHVIYCPLMACSLIPCHLIPHKLMACTLMKCHLIPCHLIPCPLSLPCLPSARSLMIYHLMTWSLMLCLIMPCIPQWHVPSCLPSWALSTHALSPHALSLHTMSHHVLSFLFSLIPTVGRSVLLPVFSWQHHEWEVQQQPACPHHTYIFQLMNMKMLSSEQIFGLHRTLPEGGGWVMRCYGRGCFWQIIFR